MVRVRQDAVTVLKARLMGWYTRRQYVEKLLPAVVRLQAWSRKRVARARFLRWRRAQVFLARYARGRAVRVDLRPAGPLPANTCLDWF